MSRSPLAGLRRLAGVRVDRPSRREVLRTTLAGAAGLLLTDLLGAAEPARATAGKRVLVVGAGFAGLAAACELAGAGYDVTVLEARQRLGGRVVSFDDFVKGKVVEGGGEFIGANHPAWAAYAKRFGLKFLDVSDDDVKNASVVLGGERLGAREAKKLLGEVFEALARINADAAPIDADEPWTAPAARELDRRTAAAWVAGLKASDRCKAMLHLHFTSENGVIPAWQSYLGVLAVVKGGGVEKYWTDSESYRCEGGNLRLARELAGAVGAERIRRGAPVAAVAVRDESVAVTLADGKRLEGDDVILAVPPGTWNRIAFDPPFPPELAPQMGDCVKFLAAVKKRFWADAGLSPDGMSDGPAGMAWEATEGQPGEGACLTAFAGGPAADTGREWKAEEVTANYLAALEPLYPGVGKHFEQGRFVNWPSDPWAKGSYSFPAPGQVTTVGPILRKGLGRLHFAGEYACPAFCGFMEGALNSGAAAARRLARRDGVVK